MALNTRPRLRNGLKKLPPLRYRMALNTRLCVLVTLALNTRPRAYAYMSAFHLARPARIAAIALALPSGVRAPVDSPP